MFKKITLENWRQFYNIDISFHPNLTVLTGANGAGKTTLLNILASNLGWSSRFVSSYQKEYGTDINGYSNSLKYTINQIQEMDIRNNSIKIGEIEYTDAEKGHIKVPENVSSTYGIIIEHQNNIPGLFINSHRPTFPYKKLNSIPSTTVNRETIFSTYYQFSKNFVFDEYRDRDKLTSTGLIKETIASLATFGYEMKLSKKIMK